MGQLVAIDQPPFYVYPCTASVLSNYCGLHVVTTMRVTDAFGEPIAGLYAAGEITGGFREEGYMSSSALGKVAVFGHAAGREAVTLGVKK